MSDIAFETTIGQLVTERPGRSRVFESLGIDYCCGGKKPFGQACREQGLDPHTVARLLDLSAQPTDDGRDWSRAVLTELTDHIELNHHGYLKRELPRLAALVQKVAAVHGSAHPKLLDVRETFTRFAAELEAHMCKEEQVLFPAIRRIDAGADPRADRANLTDPIGAMEHEHDDAGRDLARLRELTDSYAPPPGACNTYRAMLAGLEELEHDMHRHVHKENSILFPRALAAL
jgi:regulator of cell morphogenesis and NO signaling